MLGMIDGSIETGDLTVDDLDVRTPLAGILHIAITQDTRIAGTDDLTVLDHQMGLLAGQVTVTIDLHTDFLGGNIAVYQADIGVGTRLLFRLMVFHVKGSKRIADHHIAHGDLAAHRIDRIGLLVGIALNGAVHGSQIRAIQIKGRIRAGISDLVTVQVKNCVCSIFQGDLGSLVQDHVALQLHDTAFVFPQDLVQVFRIADRHHITDHLLADHGDTSLELLGIGFFIFTQHTECRIPTGVGIDLRLGTQIKPDLLLIIFINGIVAIFRCDGDIILIRQDIVIPDLIGAGIAIGFRQLDQELIDGHFTVDGFQETGILAYFGGILIGILLIGGIGGFIGIVHHRAQILLHLHCLRFLVKTSSDVVTHHVEYPFPFQQGIGVKFLGKDQFVLTEQCIAMTAGVGQVLSAHCLAIDHTLLINIKVQALLHGAVLLVLAYQHELLGHIHRQFADLVALIGDGHLHDAAVTGRCLDHLIVDQNRALKAPGFRFECQAAGLDHIGIPGRRHGKQHDDRHRNGKNRQAGLLYYI